jgi:hypothetical protein
MVPLAFCLLRRVRQYIQLATLVVLFGLVSVGPVLVGRQNELEVQEKQWGKVGYSNVPVIVPIGYCAFD